MVTVQLLLRKRHRNQSGVQRALKAAAAHGLTPISSGAATIVAQLSESAFARLSGTPGEPLNLPPDLGKYVESITLAPPHLLL